MRYITEAPSWTWPGKFGRVELIDDVVTIITWKGPGSKPTKTQVAAAVVEFQPIVDQSVADLDKDMAEKEATTSPFIRAWVKRQAKKESKTVRQVLNELRAEL